MSSSKDTPLGISVGAFSPTVWIGRLNKSRTAFLEGKQDATNMFFATLVQLVVKHYDSGARVESDQHILDIVVTKKEPK